MLQYIHYKITGIIYRSLSLSISFLFATADTARALVQFRKATWSRDFLPFRPLRSARDVVSMPADNRRITSLGLEKRLVSPEIRLDITQKQLITFKIFSKINLRLFASICHNSCHNCKTVSFSQLFSRCILKAIFVNNCHSIF